jgi:regulatory protein
LRIREELTQRGLARSDVEQALRDSGIDWREQLQDTWRRKFAGQLPADARERARQGRFLSYRGYPLDLIGQLLRGTLDD